MSGSVTAAMSADPASSHHTAANAAEMMSLLGERAAAGATVLVASHDPLVLAAADVVVEVAR